MIKDKIFNAFQLIGGAILVIGYIPQIDQILNTQMVRDINLTFSIMTMIGIILMEIYAAYLVKVKRSGHAFFITNTASTALSITMVILIFLFK
jgi:MtN3 and saliva related transmembrane protein